ncbi:MAG: MATE family efflux transporter [Cyanobacteria bacterium SBLK]|nr:MATE family efflux transporter [Cyanobacteria bacterium SBLK]
MSINIIEDSAAIDLRSRFFRLTIINVFSNIMVPLVGFIDTVFLGHLPDIRYLAGVGLSTMIFLLVYRNCVFLRMGTTGPTARAEGSSNVEEVLLILLRSGFIALILGLLILLLQNPLRTVAFSLLAGDPEVKAAGIDYFNTRIWGAPAVMINFALIGWFLGREQSGKVLVLSILGSGANIILDYLTIVHWNLASSGAGMATTVSEYLMLAIGLIFIMLEKDLLSQLFTVAKFESIFEIKAMMFVFKFNIDIWLRTIIATLIIALFVDLSSSFGSTVLAINTLILQVLLITYYFCEGSAFATETLVGYFCGQGLKNRFLPVLRLSVASSLAIGLAIAFLFIVFPDSLFGLMTNHFEILSELKNYRFWLIPVLLFCALATMLDGYFLGLTEGSVIRNAAIGGGILSLAIAFMVWQLHNPLILWLVMCGVLGGRMMIMASHVPATISSPNNQ